MRRPFWKYTRRWRDWKPPTLVWRRSRRCVTSAVTLSRKLLKPWMLPHAQCSATGRRRASFLPRRYAEVTRRNGSRVTGSSTPKSLGLSVAQMALMSQLLDEALDLDEVGRRSWLARLPSEHQELVPILRAALLPGETQGA